MFVQLTAKAKCQAFINNQDLRVIVLKDAQAIAKSADLEDLSWPRCATDLALNVLQLLHESSCDMTIAAGQVALVTHARDDIEVWCQPCAHARFGQHHAS